MRVADGAKVQHQQQQAAAHALRLQPARAPCWAQRQQRPHPEPHGIALHVSPQQRAQQHSQLLLPRVLQKKSVVRTE